MGHLYSISNFSKKFDDRRPRHQQELLERAVAKLVLIGEHAGVSAAQMIDLLESGLTVGELLDYLALRDKETGTDTTTIS